MKQYQVGLLQQIAIRYQNILYFHSVPSSLVVDAPIIVLVVLFRFISPHTSVTVDHYIFVGPTSDSYCVRNLSTFFQELSPLLKADVVRWIVGIGYVCLVTRRFLNNPY
jgi:hypothetical protein